MPHRVRSLLIWPKTRKERMNLTNSNGREKNILAGEKLTLRPQLLKIWRVTDSETHSMIAKTPRLT